MRSPRTRGSASARYTATSPPARPWSKPPTATSSPGSATRSRSCLRDLTWAEATRRWMDRFVDYMTTKRGMADALRAVIASGRNPYEQSRSQLIAAITTLLQADGEAGTLRRDIEPADVLASLGGVSLTAGEPAQREPAACSTCSWTACGTRSCLADRRPIPPGAPPPRAHRGDPPRHLQPGPGPSR